MLLVPAALAGDAPAGVAASTVTPPRRIESADSLDFGAYTLQTSGFNPQAWSSALTLRLRWPAGYEAFAGVRVLVGPLLPGGARAEQFLGIGLNPDFGVWRPSVGMELGYTGVDRLEVPETFAAPGHDRRERTDLSPLYGAVTADALRFRFGPIGLSAMQLHAGTDLLLPGRVLRLIVTFVRVEVNF